MSLAYHAAELQIALDPAHKGRCLPCLPRDYNPARHRVLDVGCGRGQTLVALHVPEQMGYGVDPDGDAIANPLTGHRLQVGGAERLNFPDNHFRMTFSRVALPYTNTPVALAEMFRTLEPQGELWLLLHAWSQLKRRALRSLLTLNLLDLAYCAYLALNSLLLNFNISIPWINGKYETVQSPSSITKALVAAGFENIQIDAGHFFIATARKP